MTIKQPISDPAERLNDTARVTAAMRAGVRAELLKHKQAGLPICVWKDGKVVWIPADEIVIEDEPDA